MTSPFFGLILNKDIDSDNLYEIRNNLEKEIDFLVIYGKLSLVEAYALPTHRRKKFIQNLKYYKELENKETENPNQNNDYNRNRLSFH